MNVPFDDSELELTFPCTWSYKVFGQDEHRMRVAIGAAVGELEHTVELSNRSRTGKYVSIEVDVTVQANEQRLAIFTALHEHDDVLYVL